MAQYVTTGEMAAYLRSTVVADAVEIESAAIAASNAINTYCQRDFTVSTVATTRSYVAVDSVLLKVHDIATITGLVVTNDVTAVAAADYQLEIAPGVLGPYGSDGRMWPWSWIRLESGAWTTSNAHTTASVTARWGWAAVPQEIILATKLICKDHFKARDTQFGITMVGDFSRRITDNPVALSLISPLRSAATFPIAFS